ncbi:glycosyltransferase [Pedobacter sp. SG918]|uniref:glycosyltransferase n=1 Tax=Pedobacter sp. SG918 TaxID=2587136 RepID=UPI00146CE571|nr:glycosyltransferase [Pedobacter sp. SG918]NMN35340.1 hypothetical protein [Pedobacter sp. SG918]
MLNNKLPISAIVVGYNEVGFLVNSLPKLAFCDEILYYDLGSTDTSVEVANNCGAKVIHHDKVPGCEWIHAKYGDKTKNKWILITDPDEIIDDFTIENIQKLFNENKLTDDIGCILAPIFYYFKNKKLLGTIWGGEKPRLLLAHNEKFSFTAHVHQGRQLRDGYIPYHLSSDNQNGIKHYWANSYLFLFKKHYRYLKNEGDARFQNSQRTSLKELALAPLKSFRICFFLAKGYKDGFTGLFLSLFWSWYETSALIRLYGIQIKQSAKH